MTLQTEKVASAISAIELGALSIAGVKTFTVSPIVPDATTSSQAASYKNVTTLSATLTTAFTIKTVKDYATSATTGTSRAQNLVNICYGCVSVGGDSTVNITNLPFATTSYTVTVSSATVDNGTNDVFGTVASASQFNIFNHHSSTRLVNWIAIGI